MANDISLGKRLKLAAKELSVGNIGNAALSLVNPYLLQPSTYNGGLGASGAGMWFFDSGNRDVWFTYSSHASCIEAYTKCAPINAVINKKAQAHLTGKQSVVNTAGKANGKEANGEMASKLKALLKCPNHRQTWNDFEAQIKIDQQLFGYALLLPLVPVGFPAIYASEIFVIPPSLCEIVEKRAFFGKGSPFESITLTYGMDRIPLPVDSVFVIRDITISPNGGFLPDSRIRALQQQINNIIGAYGARGSLIDDRGALGIISSGKTDDSGSVSMSAQEKKEIQEEFQKYGILKGKFKNIITTAALNYTAIGFATKDLMLFEEIEDDINRVCDAYGVNSRLLSVTRNNSLGGNDAEIFEKQFYVGTIIPESDSLYDQLNNLFETELYNIRLVNDFSHLAVLQADALKVAQAGYLISKGADIDFKNNMITRNEYRVAKGYEPLKENEGGELYYSDIKHLIGQPAAATSAQPDANPEEDPAKHLQNLLA